MTTSTAAGGGFERLEARSYSALMWLSRAAGIWGEAHASFNLALCRGFYHGVLAGYEATAIFRLHRMMSSLSPEVIEALTPEQLGRAETHLVELADHIGAVVQRGHISGRSSMLLHGRLIGQLTSLHGAIDGALAGVRQRIAEVRKSRFGHLDLGRYQGEMKPEAYQFLTTFVGADTRGFTTEDRDYFCDRA